MTKPVPYFPLYAANLIASRPYRLMSLSERGLWITIMMECWVNGSVPSNFSDMSKFLGVTNQELETCFSNIHSSFFEVEGDRLFSKELEEYRQGYMERREKQKEGGKLGVLRKKEKNGRKRDAEGSVGSPQGKPEGALTYINLDQIKSNQLLGVSYEEAFGETTNATSNLPQSLKNYSDASRGY
jgi:uncharacterized protein YdaU (DUF1376 family)